MFFLNPSRINGMNNKNSVQKSSTSREKMTEEHFFCKKNSKMDEGNAEKRHQGKPTNQKKQKRMV